MDTNEYLAVWLFRERLAEARASAAGGAGVSSLRSRRPGVRLRLGSTLIRLGHWILGPVPEYSGKPLSPLAPSAAGEAEQALLTGRGQRVQAPMS